MTVARMQGGMSSVLGSAGGCAVRPFDPLCGPVGASAQGVLDAAAVYGLQAALRGADARALVLVVAEAHIALARLRHMLQLSEWRCHTGGRWDCARGVKVSS